MSKCMNGFKVMVESTCHYIQSLTKWKELVKRSSNRWIKFGRNSRETILSLRGRLGSCRLKAKRFWLKNKAANPSRASTKSNFIIVSKRASSRLLQTKSINKSSLLKRHLSPSLQVKLQCNNKLRFWGRRSPIWKCTSWMLPRVITILFSYLD